MAVGKAEIRGHHSLIDWLLIPRPVTRLGLACLGVGVAHVFWIWLNSPLLAYVSGTAASFCLLCAGAVWSMRDKTDDALSGEHLGADAFRRERIAAAAMRKRCTWRAALVAVCALAAASPAISHQLAGTVWHWMVLACGAGVGEAAYSFLLVGAWEDQLRARRDRQIEAAKEAEARAALFERLTSAQRSPSTSSPGWTTPSGTLTSVTKPH